jgi:hypothetical protein
MLLISAPSRILTVVPYREKLKTVEDEQRGAIMAGTWGIRDVRAEGSKLRVTIEHIHERHGTTPWDLVIERFRFLNWGLFNQEVDKNGPKQSVVAGFRLGAGDTIT